MNTQERSLTNTIEYWELDELADIVDAFENLMEEKVSQGMKTAWDYNNLMVFTASKAIVTAREALTIAIVGYPNGVFSLPESV